MALAQTSPGPAGGTDFGVSRRAYRADFDRLMTDGQYAELFARAALSRAESAGGRSIETALALDMLTELYFYGDRLRGSGRPAGCGARAIAIEEQIYGPDDPRVQRSVCD